MEAGLPPWYWSYAAPTFCVNYNVKSAEEDSSWSRVGDEDLPGNSFPFGCLVMYNPPHTSSGAYDGNRIQKRSAGSLRVTSCARPMSGKSIIW